MKTRIVLIALIVTAGLYVVSCSPKVVAMQPSDPNIPQMPLPAKEPNAEKIAMGKSIYNEHCGNCHKLFAPEDFNQREWVPILISMQSKSKLSDADMTLISEYINSIATP